MTTGGVISGFNFVPGAAATMTSPTSVPLHLLALEQAAQPGAFGDAASGGSAATVSGNAQLRAAVVNVAGYYLRLASTRSAAQMESLIWDNTSSNAADHGPSCAAFASLTLELAAQAVGQQSWVTGGTSYPWPLPGWADVRVDTNPASPGVESLVADAQSHGRWHPLGDGYQPQPGDWVLFDGHVEVVTSDADGVLHTIGADSLPGLTVNAHLFAAPLAGQGVTGFVDNGNLQPATGTAAAGAATPAPAAASPAAPPAAPPAATPAATPAASGAEAAVPGVLGAGDLLGGTGSRAGTGASGSGRSGSPAAPAASPASTPATTPAPKPASTPTGTGTAAPAASPTSGTRYTTPGTSDQQAFISLVAPGAIAAQQRYGVPAAVTIAQAIEESAWGRSGLAAQYHNLFGIKGTGPAGSVWLPTSEYINGQWETIDAQFRSYHNDAESIADHAELLATSGYYTRAMADRAVPDAFANDLTGVYATDPHYGANLIALMKLYNLYQYDGAASASSAGSAPVSPTAAAPAPTVTPTAPASPPAASAAATPTATGSAAASGSPAAAPASGQGAAQAQVPGVSAPMLVPSAAAVTSPGSTVTAATTAFIAPGRTSAGLVTAGPARPARYQSEFPAAVTTAFFATAKAPLARGEHLYRDVAAGLGLGWQLLAAADWMQCRADPRYSPVHGEKLGSVNPGGTAYSTKSSALAQCACDLIELAAAVYGISLTARRPLSLRALAAAFAAFRWGAILQRHGVSPMEFPYSVAGLTAQHQKMHWPAIDAPDAPDRPGSRFREPLGAVPVVLNLGYTATV